MVMKKLIVFSVVFALVAGAAFAEVSFGGTVFGKVDVVKGDNVKDSDIKAGGGIGRVNVDASAESEDGSFGGWMRFRAGSWGAGASGWGLAWWKPVDAVKFQIGNNPDGIFDTTHMTRWGFYQVAGDIGIVNAGNAWGGGLGPVVSDQVFFGGFGGFGAMLSITPMDLLALNFVFPYTDGKAGDTYRHFIGQAVVNLDGIGQLNLTFQSDTGNIAKKDGVAGTPATTFYLVSAGGTGIPTWQATKPADGSGDVVLETKDVGGTPGTGSPEVKDSPGKIFASFYLSMIENLGIDLGFSFKLPAQDSKDMDHLGIGLGAQFDAGQFGIKARILAGVGGKTNDKAKPVELTFDLLPSFAINDDLTAFLSAGLGFTALPEGAPDTAQAKVNFHVNPYVRYKFDWSKGLFAGFLLESEGKTLKDQDPASDMKWSVPIGLYITL